MLSELVLLFQNINSVYLVTLTLLGISLLIAALEDLKSWDSFTNDGILSWKISKLNFYWKSRGLIAKYLETILCEKNFKTTVYLRILLSSCLVVLSCFGVVYPTLILVLFFLHFLIGLRNHYSLDGAHQMYMVILFALSLGSFAGVDSNISIYCLWFITAELIISYFIAGITKITSPIWRTSSAINVIFATRSYGSAFLYNLFRQNNTLAVISSWCVFLFEMLFFIVLFCDPIYTPIFFGLGFIFHLSNAIFMGLNSFLFAFSITYPSLMFCVSMLHQ
ncbi:MAG: hypothetical protein P0S95_06115 [Rhabdochlamydiaceae bacterium]|nr:hypothetical protein [Candidatus Amphrikana amoebophyrae]